MAPLPQSSPLVHWSVLKVQSELHFSVPSSKPWVWQVLPLRLIPSHSSPVSRVPLPQGVVPMQTLSRHCPLVQTPQLTVRDCPQVSVPVYEPQSLPAFWQNRRSPS